MFDSISSEPSKSLYILILMLYITFSIVSFISTRLVNKTEVDQDKNVIQISKI